MGQLAEGLLSASGWAALALLFTLPALEAPAFLGLVLPGELALLLGGVLAQQGRIPLGDALSSAAAPPAPGSCFPVWLASSACATGPSPCGRARPPASGRRPTSCSATWPAPAGATSTTSPAGLGWRSPGLSWSP